MKKERIKENQEGRKRGRKAEGSEERPFMAVKGRVHRGEAGSKSINVSQHVLRVMWTNLSIYLTGKVV